MSQRNNMIKLTLYDEINKRVYDLQIVSAKEHQVKLWWAQPNTSISYQPTDESFRSGFD